MGGIGSGRRSRQQTVDEFQSIDVRRWYRDGLLLAPQAFAWRWYSSDESKVSSMGVRVMPSAVVLRYSYGTEHGEPRLLDYAISIEWLTCTYGGSRPWFLCPLSGCGRRVAILYGGELFACRHCLGLAYGSQRESKAKRALRRAESIRERLGWEPLPFFSHGDRPLGMHWERYQRLTDLHDQLIARYRAMR